MEGDNLANCDIDTGTIMFSHHLFRLTQLVTSSVKCFIIQSMSGHVITFLQSIAVALSIIIIIIEVLVLENDYIYQYFRLSQCILNVNKFNLQFFWSDVIPFRPPRVNI